METITVNCTQCNLKQEVNNKFYPHPKCKNCGCSGFLGIWKKKSQ